MMEFCLTGLTIGHLVNDQPLFTRERERERERETNLDFEISKLEVCSTTSDLKIRLILTLFDENV